MYVFQISETSLSHYLNRYVWYTAAFSSGWSEGCTQQRNYPLINRKYYFQDSTSIREKRQERQKTITSKTNYMSRIQCCDLVSASFAFRAFGTTATRIGHHSFHPPLGRTVIEIIHITVTSCSIPANLYTTHLATSHILCGIITSDVLGWSPQHSGKMCISRPWPFRLSFNKACQDCFSGFHFSPRPSS